MDLIRKVFFNDELSKGRRKLKTASPKQDLLCLVAVVVAAT